MSVIAVLGLGFVGLSAALGFCEMTCHTVMGFDIDAQRAKAIKSGRVPFHEPYLPEALGKYNGSRFIVCDSLTQAVIDADFVFICVGTPCGDDGRVDLSYLTSAIEETLAAKSKARPFTLVVKSTTPPTTLNEIVAPICQKHGFEQGENINLCTNPEFLREGYSWEDFVHADRVIIGEHTEGCGIDLERLYEGFAIPVLRMSANTAEFLKYLSNSLLAAMISFSNEFATIADTIGGINISQAFKALHMDKRWFSNDNGKPAGMSSYVYPGCGYGGYCLPKDTLAIREKSKELGYTPNILSQVIEMNTDIKRIVAQKLINSAKDGVIGVLGLSFKPESDDVRDSAAGEILRIVCESGIKVYAYDPMAMENFDECYKLPIEYLGSAYDVLNHCDTVAILTAWREFINLDYTDRCVVDARYCLNG